MRIAFTSLLLAATLAGSVAASARPVHYRPLSDGEGRQAALVPSQVIPDVLVANPYGDVIITGKTGFHRSDFGVMVPDGAPPSVVATGRASGSGLGAAGLPGSNWQ